MECYFSDAFFKEMFCQCRISGITVKIRRHDEAIKSNVYDIRSSRKQAAQKAKGDRVLNEMQNQRHGNRPRKNFIV